MRILSWGISSSDQGSNVGPLLWDCGVLATVDHRGHPKHPHCKHTFWWGVRADLYICGTTTTIMMGHFYHLRKFPCRSNLSELKSALVLGGFMGTGVGHRPLDVNYTDGSVARSDVLVYC